MNGRTEFAEAGTAARAADASHSASGIARNRVIASLPSQTIPQKKPPPNERGGPPNMRYAIRGILVLAGAAVLSAPLLAQDQAKKPAAKGAPVDEQAMM